MGQGPFKNRGFEGFRILSPFRIKYFRCLGVQKEAVPLKIERCLLIGDMARMDLQMGTRISTGHMWPAA